MFSKNPYKKIGLFLAIGFSVLALMFVPRGHKHNHQHRHAHHHAHQHAHQHQKREAAQHSGAGHAASLVYTPSENITVGIREYPNRPNFEIPTFPGCGKGDYKKRLDCTREKYISFIRRHLRQPKGRKGRAVVVFTVDLAGQIEDAELYEDTDAFLSAETMRLVGIMQGADMRWTPGKIDGTPKAFKMALAVVYGQKCSDCAEVDFELYAME